MTKYCRAKDDCDHTFSFSLDPENYFSTKVSSEADEDEWMDISYDRSYVARHYHEQELDDSYFERLD